MKRSHHITIILHKAVSRKSIWLASQLIAIIRRHVDCDKSTSIMFKKTVAWFRNGMFSK